MGSLTSAIADDIKEYQRLCEKYGEIEHLDNGHSNPYDGHYSELKRREEEEYET